MTAHTYKQFDIDLEEIRTGVLQMGGLVESQVSNAFLGLHTGDRATIETVITGDHRINLLEVALDDRCARVIATRQPTAGDLRQVLGAMRIITDLERIGDEAKKVAKAAMRLHTAEQSYHSRTSIKSAAERVIEMLRMALDCFARSDLAVAPELAYQDEEVDEAFEAITRQMMTYMMSDARTIPVCLENIFIAKAIERIGDHSLNVAEHVIYIAHGHDVRYTGTESLEAEAAQDRKPDEPDA